MTVGVVIPCRNEAPWVGELLNALLVQDVRPDDVVIVDDGSTDGTRQAVEQWSAREDRFPVRIVEGPRRGIAAAVNAGVAALATDLVVRLDGHCRPAADYLRRTTTLALEDGVGVAGGAWTIEPGAPTIEARAIAIAASHFLGSGGAAYRRRGGSGERRAVDTVPFGTFRRALWEELGGFDERLRSNEDYDFNFRARARGRRVVLDPSILCTYFARPTLRTLANQYGRYGWWKARMLLRHPESIRWRQLVPALFVPALAGAIAVAIYSPPSLRPWLLAAYPLLVLTGAFHVAVRRQAWNTCGWVAAAFVTIHVSWSSAFWASIAAAPWPRKSARSV